MKFDLINGGAEAEAERLVRKAEVLGADSLDLSGLRLERLPTSLGRLKCLKRLNLAQCDWLRDISMLSGLERLESLDLSECRRLGDGTPLLGLPALRTLNLDRCGIDDFSFLSGLSTLESLDCSHNPRSQRQEESLEFLRPLKRLRRLHMETGEWGWSDGPQSRWRLGCEVDLSPLAVLPDLRDLSLRLRGSRAGQMQTLAQLQGLTALHLHTEDKRCLDLVPALSGLERFSCYQANRDFMDEGLKCLRRLEYLELYGAVELGDLNGIGSLRRLRELRLDLSEVDQSRASELDLSPLANLVDLEALVLTAYMGWNSPIEDISPLRYLEKLRRLELGQASRLEDLRPLRELKQIKQLELSYCDALRDLSPLAEMRGLESLTLCLPCIEDLSPLKKLRKLRELDLYDSGRVMDLARIPLLPNLEILRVERCSGRRGLEQLRSCRRLKVLMIRQAPRLEDLSPLRKLPRLEKLIIGDGGTRIRNIKPLAGLKSMRCLRLRQSDPGKSIAVVKGWKQLRKLEFCTIDAAYGSSVINHLPRLNWLEPLSVTTAPNELIDFERTLANLRDWQRDLRASGAEPLSELKNGSADACVSRRSAPRRAKPSGN